MATDVDVQYFSHLNGLTLGNNWGDLIRLLDKALVTGIDFTQITAASIDAQGDLTLTFYAAHNALLFQIVELSGFAASELNQKYRIKGVPNTTQLILKPSQALTVSSVSTLGTAKLAPLGYDIIFRDTNDVKRVYRAKNPTTQHPYIRVDESLTSPDGTTGVYASTYAKYAMVGLLEHMDHIDDYENPDVLQLPFDPNDPAKNWKITGTNTNVVRGWSRWIWAASTGYDTSLRMNFGASAGNRTFTLCGDKSAFYVDVTPTTDATKKCLYGCGVFNSGMSSAVPDWFLMSLLTLDNAAAATSPNTLTGGLPLAYNDNVARFFVSNNSSVAVSSHVQARPIIPDYFTGRSNIFSGSNLAALEIPFHDTQAKLRGTLKHVAYNGKSSTTTITTPLVSDNSMYVSDFLWTGHGTLGGLLFYLGELE